MVRQVAQFSISPDSQRLVAVLPGRRADLQTLLTAFGCFALTMSWACVRPCRHLLVQKRPRLTFRATLAIKRTGSGSVQPSPVEGVSRTPSPLPPEPRRQQRALAVVLGFGVHHAGDATGVSGENLNQCTSGSSAHIPAWACCVQMVLAASMLCVASSC